MVDPLLDRILALFAERKKRELENSWARITYPVYGMLTGGSIGTLAGYGLHKIWDLPEWLPPVSGIAGATTGGLIGRGLVPEKQSSLNELLLRYLLLKQRRHF